MKLALYLLICILVEKKNISNLFAKYSMNVFHVKIFRPNEEINLNLLECRAYIHRTPRHGFDSKAGPKHTDFGANFCANSHSDLLLQ